MDANKIREIRIIRGNPRFRHYPEYKESSVKWIGEIPKHCEMKRLKYVADLNMGQSPPSEEYNSDQIGTPFLQGNAEFGMHHPTPKIYCPTAKKHASPGDILVSVRAPVGALNIADQEYGIGRGLCAIRPRMNQLERHYAKYLLEVVRTELHVVATGSTYDAVTVDEVSNLTCVVPSFSEQIQIANFLDRKTEQIDELIRLKERRIELLQAQRTALINQVVTKGLDPNVEMKPSGVEWIGEIPRHWEVRRNKRIFYERDDRSATGKEELLTVSHITGVSPRAEKKNVGMFLAETLEGYKHCSVGNLVINTMWAWMGALGVSTFDGIVSPSYNVYQLKSSEYLPRYYDYLYRIPNHVTEIIRWSKGIWHSRWRLYPDAFFSMFTITPPFREQAQIVDFLDCKTEQIDELISAEQRKIELLKEYRQSLISEAVTGKIDVRNEV